MTRLLDRANMVIKWRRSEGRRERAIWIDGPTASRDHFERTRRINADGTIRRII